MKRSAIPRRKSDRELDDLKRRLREAEETLEAIRNGQIDALIVSTPAGPKLYTLEGADERYRRLVETMNEGALLLNPAGMILYCNAAFAKLVEQRLEATAGRPFSTFVHPDSAHSFEALLRASDTRRVSEELVLRTTTGRDVSVFVSMAPNEGPELGACVVVTDLTVQKRNTEIVASERLASSILEQAAEAIIVCDPNGNVIRANRAATDIAAGQPLHQHVFEAFPLREADGAGDAPHPAHPASAALKGTASTGREMELHVEGRPTMCVLCSAAPLLNERLETLGCVMSITDITAQKHAEAERVLLLDAERAARAFSEKARADAESSNRSKDEFLATVSHELRTPLNAIVGWSHLLSADDVGEDRRRHGIGVIRRNADAQVRLIEDLLDVSRIVSGKMRLEVSPVSLEPLVRNVLESVKPALDAKEIRVEAILDDESGTIIGDAARLQQVIWNLVSNAAKFTPRKGRIRIVLRRVESAFEISVEDNGQGIKPEFLPYVFDRFRQADAGIDRAHGGLGLGLAIARHLVELHGGAIRVTSDGIGKGAAFTIYLPCAAVRGAPASIRAPAPAQTSAPRGHFECPDLEDVRVLVIEDEDDSRELLVNILATCGARAEGLKTGAEALEWLEREVPHVVVSDIGMAGMDGYALIRRIRSLPSEAAKRVPALALTAYARGEDRKRALSEGFQMHLAKPVDPGELAVAVASLAKFSALGR